ncbi:TIGR02302 family protein [Ferrovibrio xuzhouensis]|uniref:TIGR02302 family protein n=1 Tax=Ferrovibrio xuzhouensis TaxID=1576914 RepID=A0ABV7VC90_9PROT
MAQRGESVGSPDIHQPAALPPLLARRLFLARAALFWEGFWPGLLPAAMVAAVFLILAGFDVWRFTPVWLHWAALAGFTAAFGAALWQGLHALRWPGKGDATRRLERINRLDHRPLEAAADRLSPEQQDPIARALWTLHRRLALQRLATARVGTPEAGWWRRDVWGLRAALGLLLVVAWASPGEDRAQRLTDTLNPGTALPPGTVLALDAWITPPAYTGRAPIFLTRDGKPVAAQEALKVPVGSQLQLRLAAPASGFALRFGKAAHTLKAVDEHHAELDLPLDLSQGGTATLALLRHDSPFADWPLSIVPDLPPQIGFDGAPKTGRQNTLDIGMAGEDDYGLQAVQVEMARAGAEAPVTIDWPVPPAAPGPVTDKQSFDLLSHPWAGLEVAMTLVAKDAVGQSGRSETVTVTLPARKFRHPVAKAIVEQRRDLALHPGQWQRVVTSLKALTLAPEMYDGDVAPHLGLRMAATRLQLSRLPETVASVQALLWQIALQLEDGRRSQSERDFQALMDRLQDAIDRNADDSEIQRLMQELRTAMDRMIDEMMRDAMERMARGEQPEMLDDDQQALGNEDLQDMMDRAQEMAQMGDRDQARDLLRQLQQMMEAMKNGRLAQMPEGRGRRGRSGQMQPGQMMQEFSEMMRQQQQLLDRSFRRSQQYGRNGGKPGDNEADSRAQEDLRRRLGEMMNRLAEGGAQMPDTLGHADRAMRDARDALKRGEPGDAMQGQTDALDQLRQGLRDMQQAQRGNPDGQAPSADARQNNRNPDRDPFGRTANGYDDNARDNTVPDIAPVERARRILEELQRRASDRERPAAERDYLGRLLQRF